MATTLPNMGLVSWTASTDPFSYTQLSANWSAVDAHDHSSGKGVQIPTAGIANLAVTNPKLAANAVDASKVADGTLTSAKFASSVPIGYAAQKQGIQLIRSTAATTNGTLTVSWESATFQNGGTWWSIGTPTTFTPPETGYYFVHYTANITVAVASKTWKGNVYLYNGSTTVLNSTYLLTSTSAPTSDGAAIHCSGIVQLTNGVNYSCLVSGVDGTADNISVKAVFDCFRAG